MAGGRLRSTNPVIVPGYVKDLPWIYKICMSVCVYTENQTLRCVYSSVSTHIHIHTDTHARTHAHTHTHTHIQALTYVRIYVCTHARMHAHPVLTGTYDQ